MPDPARLAALRREYSSVGLDLPDLSGTWQFWHRRPDRLQRLSP